ncbi:hypothetical protein MST27_14305 [Pseudomonas sp. PS1]|uniref:VOC domain-containing protein n=1 Tax=Stutzerimonas marianensis TaxID=2929513 RepID=A0A9X2AVF5_9GAMM|nr:hypothetical protein [Pseudomonas marianensis]MCJ0974542.1 hypothetical protein [Pseudomonas marianensis]
MKRFHIALAVDDLQASIAEYDRRLGQAATVVVPGRYAMWRTELLNFSINEMPGQGGTLRHVGFEIDGVEGFSSDTDCNGLVWERFCPAAQDHRIRQIYGPPSTHGGPFNK